MKKTYYAVQGYEIIRCHVIAHKDQDERGPYAANSKRDKRRFREAFTSLKEAQEKVAEYEILKGDKQ